MFSFLNSTVLVAALAALVPLIIHLFSKRRVMIVEFSSLRHLKAMQKRQVRRLKIRQLLLLILRMLIILLVVIAFARPTMTGGAIGSHAAVSAAILLDNSGSMDRYVSDGNLFEIARKRTKELLGTFGEADEVVLIPLAEDAETAAAGLRLSSSAVALKQLQQFTAGSAVADLESALDKASDLLGQATSLNKEIHVITDRQRCSLPERTVPIESDTRVVLMDLPDEGNENCGITAVDFGGQLLIPGHDFDVTATVKNYGSSDRADLIASLFLDGNRVAQTDVKAAAGQETVARFTRSVSRTGFHSGWVELSDDKFRGDNLYYFSFHIPNRFNLLIVRGEAAADFISLALVPSRSINQYWSVKEVDPENLSGVSFRDYDVVVLSGAPDLQGVYVDRLAAYVDRGGSL
ncbi:MAG: BatA domain-containing protein, partial [candidate division Zixibacteria bacterium]|nr:BatA domain-containing protein [candidate division Zixibacteria bacterium]